MNLDERLKEATVIGAAGKMGSGIALLLAQEMARLSLRPENKGISYKLNLIDLDRVALVGLVKYIRVQAVKAAEKSIVELRKLYADRADLVENGDIITQFAEDVVSVLWTGTDLSIAKGSNLIFEAIAEKIEIKVSIFKTLDTICPGAFYFTNTSSIPIHLLDEGAGLGGRIIGFHFYNPPAVQKLAELISGEDTCQEIKDISLEIAKRLRKKVIPANDIAGFIGNGHFIRDGMHAIGEVERLSADYKPVEATYLLNKVSQDFLVRPMGIFQLIDYVGIDVFQCIQTVMDEHITQEHLRSDLIDKMVEAGVLGGQRSDGSQKDGFLSYKGNRPTGVYSLDEGKYLPLDKDGWSGALDQDLGALPGSYKPWRRLLMDPKKGEKLAVYFEELNTLDTLGAGLAEAYLKRSKEIGLGLVNDGVSDNAENVNGVLLNGFYHLYGPINDYVREEG